MNSSKQTIKFAGVAAISALIAWGAWTASKPSIVEGFVGIGEVFFPDFEDAASATALTVVDYDDDVKDAAEFSVSQNDKGVWTIPSHHDYPAEAEDRLARTATSLMGVKKTAIQSRIKDDWKRFGVVDPTAEGIGTVEERGTRLTLSDGSGNPLVDLIVGNQVEGRSGHYYVREPDKDITYITELDVDLSAKFSDWIEPDLLKITTSDVSTVTLDNYSIDESTGTVKPKEKLNFAKVDSKWTLEGLDDEKEELDESPVTALVTNLDQLKIVGVRPKPKGLDSNLRLPAQIKQALQDRLDSEMGTRGFFFGGDGEGRKRLYSNEGDMIAGLTNGVQYSLYFGEVAPGSGKDIEVGLSEGDAKEESQDDTEDTDEDSGDEDGPRRYLFLKAEFNEKLLGERPVAPVEPVKPDILAEDAPEEDAATEKEKDAEPADGEEEGDSDEGENEEDPNQTEVLDFSSAVVADEDQAKEAVEEVAEEAKDETAKTEEATEEKPEQKPATEEKPAADEAPEEEKTQEKKAEPEPATSEKPMKKAEEKPAAEEEKAEEPAEAKAAPPAEPKKSPKEIAQEEYDKAMAAYNVQKTAYDGQLTAFEAKVTTGKEKAEELASRFADWYYVISSDSFEKFRLTRTDVIKKKEVKEDDAKKDDAEAKK